MPCVLNPGSGIEPVRVSASGEGLAAGTTYDVRIVASNSGGTSYGTAQTLTTLPAPLPPTVQTGVATSVGQTLATFNATVNPNGEAVSDCHFDYGTTTSYGSRVPCSTPPGSGVEPVQASAHVEGLAAGTTYDVRIVASNSGGTSYGTAQTLTTLPAPSSSQPQASPASAGTPTTAILASPLGGTSPFTTSREPLLSLAKLGVRPSAAGHGRRSREVAVSYVLSTGAQVELTVDRRVISRRCRSGAPTCIHWAPTKVRTLLVGRAGTNTLVLNIGALTAGDYRLDATPISRSGLRGLTHYVHFAAIA